MSNQSTADRIQPFRQFIDAVSAAKLETYAAHSEPRTLDHSEFEKMRTHLMELYQGVSAPHSFADESGQIFDCIPVEQQPSLRGTNFAIAKPADMPRPERNRQGGAQQGSADTPQEARPMFVPGTKDRFGNDQTCPDGMIPMRRVTLEEMSRLGSMEAFLRKGPVSATAVEQAVSAHDALSNHRWAHANQGVNNHGGHSFVNIWQPGIGANQFFSLAQHWYVGGSGVNLQSAEVGWQVFPGKYGDAKPHLFIYFTPDNYKTGGYNMDVSGFVHTNKQYGVGGAIGPVSVKSGTQYELEMAFWLNGSNWWMYAGGTDAAHAIGYYPTTVYKGGQMATCATSIDYGGEVDGNGSFANMGSGSFAKDGWGKAAYQRDILYYSTANGAINASLTAQQPSPACFTSAVNLYAAPWFESIYFGGPGGNGC